MGIEEIFITSPSDWLRLVNLALGVVIVVAMLASVRRLSGATRAQIMVRLAVAAYAVATLIGALEHLQTPSPPPGIRVHLILLANTWTLAALILDRRDNNP